MEMSKEIWKDIPKFERVYQVSNKGNVKRLSYIKVLYNGGEQFMRERLLKTKKESTFEISCQHEGYKRSYSVNRLVYSLFNNVKVQRNHLIIAKDGNQLNCKLENLKLITRRNYTTARSKNKTGYTGLVDANENGYYSAKIDFEGKNFTLHTSKNMQECQKLYQAAKICFEEYDRIKTEILSSKANNRLINKSVKN